MVVGRHVGVEGRCCFHLRENRCCSYRREGKGDIPWYNQMSRVHVGHEEDAEVGFLHEM